MNTSINQLNFAGNISGGTSLATFFLNTDTSGDSTTTFRFAGNNTERATINLNRGGIIVANPNALGNAANIVDLDPNSNPTLGDLRFEIAGSFANPVFFQSATGINAEGNVVTLTGQLTGSATWNAFGTTGSTLILAGAGDTNSGAVTVTSGATVTGAVSFSAPVSALSGGAVNPGAVAGTGILATGSETFAAGSVFTVDLNSTTVGAGYDQLAVTGAVNINNATLSVIPAAGLAVGSSFTILSNDGVDPVLGQFQGLAEGSVFTQGGVSYSISYKGGDGNDVVLTVIAPLSPTIRYVSSAWSTSHAGDTILDADPMTPGNQSAVYGTTAFASLNAAIAASNDGDVIIVNSGAYAEDVNLTKKVTVELQQGPSSFGSLASTANNGAVLNLNGVALTVGSDGASTTYFGQIFGGGSITKTGSGTLTLSGTRLLDHRRRRRHRGARERPASSGRPWRRPSTALRSSVSMASPPSSHRSAAPASSKTAAPRR